MVGLEFSCYRLVNADQPGSHMTPTGNNNRDQDREEIEVTL